MWYPPGDSSSLQSRGTAGTYDGEIGHAGRAMLATETVREGALRAKTAVPGAMEIFAIYLDLIDPHSGPAAMINQTIKVLEPRIQKGLQGECDTSGPGEAFYEVVLGCNQKDTRMRKQVEDKVGYYVPENAELILCTVERGTNKLKPASQALVDEYRRIHGCHSVADAPGAAGSGSGAAGGGSAASSAAGGTPPPGLRLGRGPANSRADALLAQELEDTEGDLERCNHLLRALRLQQPPCSRAPPGGYPHELVLLGGAAVLDIYGYDNVPLPVIGGQELNPAFIQQLPGGVLMQEPQWEPLRQAATHMASLQWARYDQEQQEEAHLRTRRRELRAAVIEITGHQSKRAHEQQQQSTQQIQATAHVGPQYVCYLHKGLGRYIPAEEIPVLFVRAAFEVVYATARPTSDGLYRATVRREDQSIQAWGGWVLAQMDVYPHITMEEHVAIYTDGLRFPKLRTLADAQLIQMVAPTLQQVINVVEGVANGKMRQLSASQRNGGADAQSAAAELAEWQWRTNGRKSLQGKPNVSGVSAANDRCWRHPRSVPPHTNKNCPDQQARYNPAGSGVPRASAKAVQGEPWPDDTNYYDQDDPSYGGYGYGHDQAGAGWDQEAPACAAYERYAPGMKPVPLQPKQPRPVSNPGGGGGRPGPGAGERGAAKGFVHQLPEPRVDPSWPKAASGLPLPPPQQGDCEVCGGPHYPFVCACKYPHCARPNMNLPQNPMSKAYMENELSKLPRGSSLGSDFKEWVAIHKPRLSAQDQARMDYMLRRQAPPRERAQAHAALAEADDCGADQDGYVLEGYEQQVMAAVPSGRRDWARETVEEHSVWSAADEGRYNTEEQWGSAGPGVAAAVCEEEEWERQAWACPTVVEAAPWAETGRAAAMPRSFLTIPEEEQAGSAPARPQAASGQPQLLQRLRQRILQQQRGLEELQQQLQELEEEAAGQPRAVAPGVVAAARASLVLKNVQEVSAAELPTLPRALESLRVRLSKIPRGITDPSQRLLQQLRVLRCNKEYTLDFIVNENVATGVVFITSTGRCFLLQGIALDSGCTFTIVTERVARLMGLRWWPSPITVTMADGNQTVILGMTDPGLLCFAGTTEHETYVPLMTLVLQGEADGFAMLTDKVVMDTLDVTVRTKAGVLEYTTSKNQRHQLPIKGYRLRDTANPRGPAQKVAAVIELGSVAEVLPAALPRLESGACSQESCRPVKEFRQLPVLPRDQQELLLQGVCWLDLELGGRFDKGVQELTSPARSSLAFAAVGVLAGQEEPVQSCKSQKAATPGDVESESRQLQRLGVDLPRLRLGGSEPPASLLQASKLFAVAGIVHGWDTGRVISLDKGTLVKLEDNWLKKEEDVPPAYFRLVSAGCIGGTLSFNIGLSVLWLVLWSIFGLMPELHELLWPFIRVSCGWCWRQVRKRWEEWVERIGGDAKAWQEWWQKHQEALRKQLKRRRKRSTAPAGDPPPYRPRLKRAVQLVPAVSGFVVLLLLFGTMGAQASPAAVMGTQVVTGNLAAWELAHLAPQHFAAGAAYWQDEWAKYSATAAAAHHPHGVDPLQLEQLQPDGPQFRPVSEIYTKDEEHLWSYGNHPDAGGDYHHQLKDVLLANKSAFAYSAKEMPGYKGPPVEIKLTHDRPIFKPPRNNYSKLERSIQDEKCTELKEAGFIERADPFNKYASQPVMPAKKNEKGEWVDRRFCVDLRGTNEAQAPMAYQLPLPEQLFAECQGMAVFSCLDLRAGFHQLPLSEESKKITAFWWNRELWQYTALPFGSRNSSAVFQRVMDEVLRSAGLSHCARAFVDDVLIMSPDLETHLKDVDAVLKALHAVGLRVHPGKSVFAADKVEYLGHVVTPHGLEPMAAKVRAIADLPEPTNVSGLRHVLGLMSYYRGFCPNFSVVAKPLNDLLKKDVPYVWEKVQAQALQKLKGMLTTEGLALRRPDPEKPYVLHTDWSCHGIGAVLGQLDDEGREYMVACASRSLNIHERNYTPWRGELLAAVWGIKHFRAYLHGSQFELVTDHQPLLWLLSQQELSGQHARWVLALQEYSFHVRHRPGVKHVNADVLSRFPNSSTVDGTGARMDLDSDPHTMPLPAVAFGTGLPKPLPPDQVPKTPDASGKMHTTLQDAAKTQASAARQTPAAQVALALANVPLIKGQALALGHRYQQEPSWLDAYNFREHELAELPHSHWGVQHGEDAAPYALERRESLQRKATGWLQSAVQVNPALGQQPAPPISTPGGVDTTIINGTFFTAATAGLVVYEPFGGLCAGLEMVLRNGFPVRQYFYSDTCPIARAVARHRLGKLLARYPDLLPPSAVASAFTALPQDVYQVSAEQLQQLVAAYPQQWLVVGGWECQDLSPAGKGKGLQGDRSKSIGPLMYILSTLQHLQQGKLPPGYLLENTAFQYSLKEQVREDFNSICDVLGAPVCLDAAQFGSYAHRLRNWWTNIVDPKVLKQVTAQARRPRDLKVSNILGEGRTVRNARMAEAAPFYPCNTPGAPLSALPTLLAYPQSWAFRGNGPGVVYAADGTATEPCAEERELALGYQKGDTAAKGLQDRQRCEVLGRCMDANNLESIMAVAAAWYRREQWKLDKRGVCCNVTGWLPNEVSPGAVAEATQVHNEGLGQVFCTAVLSEQAGGLSVEQYLCNVVVAAAAEAQEAPVTKAANTSKVVDVWADAATLQYLRGEGYPSGCSELDKARVRRRAKFYELDLKGELWRQMPDGSKKLVPKPEVRAGLVQEFHQRCGHFGVRRTGALLQTSHWWNGMWEDVSRELSKCHACSRVRSSFNANNPTLKPLPIQGMFYRWGVDLAGPLCEKGNRYCMVCIEHFSKHVELIPIPDKEAKTTAAAFASAVLGRFGSCAEVLTDGGSEFKGEFDDLLLHNLIDHRVTSPSHPQADGLAERCVGTIKRGLSKYCAQKGDVEGWEEHLPWLALGYRCSPQKATGLSPYQLLYAVTPTIPPAVKPRLEEPVDWDDSERAWDSFLHRAELVKEYAVTAGNNLKIAQHKDTLRYARLRDGSYLPQVRRFRVDDYVYVRRHNVTALEIEAHPAILRVLEVRESGVLILQGRDGRVMAVHLSACAPCHLPNIDPTMDLTLGPAESAGPCNVCHMEDDPQLTILCDNCNDAYHLRCLTPPLSRVPAGDWLCSDCLAQGVTRELLQEAREKAAMREQELVHPERYTPAQKEARELDGRLVIRNFINPVTRRTKAYWGKLYFLGHAGRKPLRVVYEDGDAEDCYTKELEKRGIQLQPEGTVLPEGVVIPVGERLRQRQRELEQSVQQAGGSRSVRSTRGNATAGGARRQVAATCKVATCALLASGVVGQQLPRQLPLATVRQVQEALQLLMPGPWKQAHVTRVHHQLQAVREAVTGAAAVVPEAVTTVREEVLPLLQAVDFSLCHSFVDPFSGWGVIGTCFKEQGLQVTTNDLNPARQATLQEDALDPGFYRRHPAQVLVASPPFSALDLAAPLLAAAAGAVACLHVPGMWLSSAHTNRQRWLQQMAAEGRLQVLLGLPRGPAGRRNAWVLCFANACIKERMMRVQGSWPCTYMPQV